MILLLSIGCLALGLLGLIIVVATLFQRLENGMKFFNIGGFLFGILFSATLIVGVLVGIDDMKKTHITEAVIARVKEKIISKKEVISTEKSETNSNAESSQKEEAKK